VRCSGRWSLQSARRTPLPPIISLDAGMNRRRLMWIRPLSCLRHTTMWAKLLLFWGCLSAAFVRSSVRPFVLLVRSCYHDISWTAWTISMDLTENNYWWPRDILKVKGQRLRSQQAVQVSKACTATFGRQSPSCSLLLLKVSVTTNYELNGRNAAWGVWHYSNWQQMEKLSRN